MSHTSGDTDNHKAENNFIPSSRWGEDVLVDAKLVERNLFEIKQRIAPCKPRIIGVTKYFGLNAVVSGYEAGLRDFGESRATDAIRKIEMLPEEVRKGSEFHFIGHLQSNKAEKVVEYFDYIHSIDSLRLATVVSKAACRLNKREKVLLQVNIAGEIQKFGYEKEQLKNEMAELLKLQSIEIIGLMSMGRLGAPEDELRAQFSDLRKLRDELERDFDVKLPELSMGMSDDYHIAIEEGATIIRIGRKLFI
jgi:pyridoxal phosphate enzyme (YggS family)